MSEETTTSWNRPTTVGGMRLLRAIVLFVFTAFSIGLSAVAMHYASQASGTSGDEAAAVFVVLLIVGLTVGGVLTWRTRKVYRRPKSQRNMGLKYGAMFVVIGLMQNADTQTLTAAFLAAVMIVCTSLMAFTFALVRCEESLRRRRELGLIS